MIEVFYTEATFKLAVYKAMQACSIARMKRADLTVTASPETIAKWLALAFPDIPVRKPRTLMDIPIKYDEAAEGFLFSSPEETVKVSAQTQ